MAFKRKKQTSKPVYHDSSEDSSSSMDNEQDNRDEFEEDNEVLDDSLIEYEDTLYTQDAEGCEETGEKQVKGWKRQHWETPKEIEEKIDTMDTSKTKQKSSHHVGEVEAKVDALITKGPQRPKEQKPVQHSSDVPEGFEKLVHKKTGLVYYKRK